MPEELLRIDSLDVEFSGPRGARVQAVDQVSLVINEGETLGLVGESGSGKTTIGAAALGLAPVKDGRISFLGEDITRAVGSRRRAISKNLQVIFQDPYGSLNPSRTIEQTLEEPLLAHQKLRGSAAAEAVGEMLERVGLPRSAAHRYPTQFSGGQRQRIAIARALMARPRLVICDEPVSALDLSVQAQVLNLLLALQEDLGASYLFISHDLAVVRHISQRIVVLYRGRVMEAGDAATIHERPAHPYSQVLLAASPVPDPREQLARRERIASYRARLPDAPTSACPFASRCAFATEICTQERPPLAASPTGTLVACHHADQATAAYLANQKATSP